MRERARVICCLFFTLIASLHSYCCSVCDAELCYPPHQIDDRPPAFSESETETTHFSTRSRLSPTNQCEALQDLILSPGPPYPGASRFGDPLAEPSPPSCSPSSRTPRSCSRRSRCPSASARIWWLVCRRGRRPVSSRTNEGAIAEETETSR